MKKLLIAAAAVGAAASMIMYFRRSRTGQRLMEEGAEAAKDAQGTIRKYMRKSKNDAKQIYSNAMG
ncbi:hypothetical protein SAMN05660909_05040 [Chitinophaga terrae (ex Kim and Jung 2007)]|jgi:hypothetical protein|uniref:Uncharacterized protein n=1 Tax=Chitinophaga terrae (ex Kim and Jung 2007) TaxID=408074 RepID=A0A1H4G978_9BACT|nr:hypothetical protein [Chitinophaga terrae (ex Kim and Jung 2007)]MDQ0109090.1 hypothetical protein [Chitinophaga terrae (ex Kim and Jung 2007)]GEP93211.1 hypothetical protein CTE07_48560 [Chitinophaga terrae (ex Kim and Jung 2007)]SEB05841.1 hypothetical protein SAMN05660909_05040 [Chitinophaga terrae (ex Kim and Jung 2007)]